MRTICRTTGAETSFIIADLPPAFHKAARSLYYGEIAEGFAKTLPAGAPHLDRIYRNFARYAEEMILQNAGAQPVPWEQSLAAFMQRVEQAPADINWYLVGSTALAVRGLDVMPHDLDIAVDDAGARRLADLLLDYMVEPLVRSEGWICNWFGRAFLHARLEWVGGVHADVDTPDVTDFGPLAASRLEVVRWRGHEVRVPPLDLQLAVSKRRGLTDRVAKIQSRISTT